MALRVDDELSKYLEENQNNYRFDNWLFHALLQNPNSQIHKTIGGSSTHRDAIVKELRRTNTSKEKVKEARKACLIPESNFDWFEDSRRFFRWLTNAQINNRYITIQINQPNQNLLKLSYKELCIALVDALQDSQESKTIALEKLKIIWNHREKIGKVFAWIDKDNEQKKAELVAKEIKKFRAEKPPYLIAQAHGIEADHPTCLEDLLILLDSYEITHQEALSASKAAKARFSSIAYRMKEDKGQLNVRISREVIDSLDSLSSEFRLSKAKIIEFLIEEESKKKQYISAKIAAWLNNEIS